VKKAYACLFPVRNGRRRAMWEVTNACNAKCKHCCSSAADAKEGELSYEQSLSLLDDLYDRGFNEIYFSGGEPLMKERFVDIVEYARKKFSNVVFSTNGMLVDEGAARRIAKIGADYVNISIDSISPEKHDAMRGVKGLHRKAVSAAKMLAENGANVRLGFTITNDNWQEISEFAELAKATGAGAVVYNFFLPIGRGADNPEMAVRNDVAKSVVNELCALRERYEVREGTMKVMYRRFPDKGVPLEECPGGDRLLHISPDGTASPCSWIEKLEPSYSSGSRFPEVSVKELLASEGIKSFRELVKERKKTDCGPCKAEGCGHGCPALARVSKGSLKERDPICESS